MGKMPETIQLIGALEYKLENHGIEYILQTPTQAKSRFKDDDLPRYIPGFEKRPNGRYYLNGKQVNDHIRDALKHLLPLQLPRAHPVAHQLRRDVYAGGSAVGTVGEPTDKGS